MSEICMVHFVDQMSPRFHSQIRIRRLKKWYRPILFMSKVAEILSEKLTKSKRVSEEGHLMKRGFTRNI